VGEPIQQLIDTKCEHDAADEAAFVEYGAVEDITCRVEGLKKSHGRCCDQAMFIAGLFEGCLAWRKETDLHPEPGLEVVGLRFNVHNRVQHSTSTRNVQRFKVRSV
jgi:hypothetical protein